MSLFSPLNLFQKDEKATDCTLYGAHAKPFREVTRTHTVHRHACNALYAEIIRHPLLWSKNGKTANRKLTPSWAWGAVQEAIESYLVLGYFAWRVIGHKVEISVPCTLDLKFYDADWHIINNDDIHSWSLVIIDPPFKLASGSANYNSAASHAMADTLIYDEMYENCRRRDHFNSRPSCFTSVDKNLKNQSGSTKQWFQESTASDVAASRASSIDSNFQSLVHNRAQSIKRLEETSSIARERLTPIKTILAGTKTNLEKYGSNMQHTEHVVTDGREAHSTRALLSLTDGHQVLNTCMYNICFHFKVPPQVMG
tara:strand:+ start:10605 stop:11540 length:936 start_codon:yes stop_codon:yes gene_type:complete